MERMSCLPRVTGTSTVRLPASGGAARLMTSTFFIAATGGLGIWFGCVIVRDTTTLAIRHVAPL